MAGFPATAEAGTKSYRAATALEEVVMKTATIIRLAIGVLIIPFIASFLALPMQQARAQEAQGQQAQDQDSSYQEPSEKYSQEELAQMLAPIALYPDALLSQVLMAATYPIEVIEADRWVRKNPDLKDEALDDALLDKDWDPSVKAVCHVPSVLALMSERIAETTSIGNAFLAQENEVLDMVQELRAKAHAQGNIRTTTEQKVIVEKETIIIEQTDPRVIYVPYYDPWYIYGPWWYPAYPPYYWGPPGVSIGIGISYWPGIYFGFAFGSWSYFDWHRHNIYVDVHRRPRYVRHDHWTAKPGPWNHAPSHRRGVAYRDKPTARKYGQYHSRTREFRPETRGFPGPGDRDRRGTDNRDTRPDAATRSDRNQQERQRPEINRQDRERTSRDQQQRPKIEPERQDRQRVESGRQVQERTRIEPERQARQRIEPERQDRQRVESGRQVQERTRIEPERQARQRIEPVQQGQQQPRVQLERQDRQRVEPVQQMQQRTVQERQTQQRVERQQYQRSSDDVFNRVDDGRREMQSSQRGRDSRQGPDNYSRGSNRSGSDNRGGQGGQGGRTRGNR